MTTRRFCLMSLPSDKADPSHFIMTWAKYSITSTGNQVNIALDWLTFLILPSPGPGFTGLDTLVQTCDFWTFPTSPLPYLLLSACNGSRKAT
jgi:hypothetical protein